MKTNDLLNQLADDISDSYDVIKAGGGAMPSDRITWNLANAIRSVPGPTPPVPPSDNPYGKVGYYPWSQARDISGDMVEIGDIDENKLDEFLDTYPYDGGMSEFMYEQDWDSEDPESNYVWLWNWEEGELKIQPEDFASTTGIQATLEEGTDWACIRIETMYEVDTEADLLYAEFTSEEELQNAGWGGGQDLDEYVITVGNARVYNQAIKSFEFGSEVGDFPDDFLYTAHRLDTIDTSRVMITSVGRNFLCQCSRFNSPIDLSYCTSIGVSCLQGCSYFNQPLDLSNVTNLGAGLLYNCPSFNSRITLNPSMTSLPAQFLYYCRNFNQPLDVSNVTSFGMYFLANCSSFNQPLDTSRATTIHRNFLDNCTSFNQPLTLTSLTTIGPYFLLNCTSFNQNITIPATVTQTIDDNYNRWSYFMQSCNNMASTITWNSTTIPKETSSTDIYSLAVYSSSSTPPTYPIYQTGVTIVGDGASRLKRVWPNMTNPSQWRNLK